MKPILSIPVSLFILSSICACKPTAKPIQQPAAPAQAAILEPPAPPPSADPPRTPEPPRMTNWEYKVIIETNVETAALAKEQAKRTAANRMTVALIEAMPGNFVDLDTEPNIAGEHGWELVAAVPQVETLSPDPAEIGKMAFVNTRTAYIILYFKRPAK